MIRSRVACAWCGRRRMCWPMRRHVWMGERWTRTAFTIQTCDNCLMDLKHEGAFDDDA